MGTFLFINVVFLSVSLDVEFDILTSKSIQKFKPMKQKLFLLGFSLDEEVGTKASDFDLSSK